MAWDNEQYANARVIAAVGKQMGMSPRDILIALMTAMQESGLHNQRYLQPGSGDRDSIGLFQQRPSQGWGSVAQVGDPIYAATQFFSHLKKMKNRNNLQLYQAAQAVQRSADPYAYAKHEDDARTLMNNLGLKGGLPSVVRSPTMSLDDYGALAGPEQTVMPTMDAQVSAPDMGLDTSLPGMDSTAGSDQGPTSPGSGSIFDATILPQQSAPKQPGTPGLQPGADLGFPAVTALAGGGARSAVVNAALAVIGTPYSWGGGNAKGATLGTRQGAKYPDQAASTVGFDCSGLVQYALNQAGLRVGDMTAAQQMRLGRQVPVNQLEPGDLVAAPDGGHIAIYLGDGKMIEAPSTGSLVRISQVGRGMVGIKLGLSGGGNNMQQQATPVQGSMKYPGA